HCAQAALEVLQDLWLVVEGDDRQAGHVDAGGCAPDLTRNRQSEVESGTQAGTCTLCPDAAAVRLDQALANREPQADAFDRGILTASSLELVENPGEVLRLDSFAVVRNAHANLVLVALSPDLDSPAGERELAGVDEEVLDDLEDAAFVGHNLGQPVINLELDCAVRIALADR